MRLRLELRLLGLLWLLWLLLLLLLLLRAEWLRLVIILIRNYNSHPYNLGLGLLTKICITRCRLALALASLIVEVGQAIYGDAICRVQRLQDRDET